jgi:hypothetical protein
MRSTNFACIYSRRSELSTNFLIVTLVAVCLPLTALQIWNVPNSDTLPPSSLHEVDFEKPFSLFAGEYLVLLSLCLVNFEEKK